MYTLWSGGGVGRGMGIGIELQRCNLIPVPTTLPTPHLTLNYTHLRPTTPTIPFYDYIFCVLLLYYTIFCVPLNLNSPTPTYSVLFTVFCTLLLFL